MIKKLALFFVFYLLALNTPQVFANESDTIYIYNDSGVSQESLVQTVSAFKKLTNKNYSVQKITAKQVIQGDWTKNAALFVMPGGADLPYVEKLNGKGNDVIKEYVNNGGSFLGICAGSYYASAYVEFDKGGALEVLGDRELKFFSGKAIGPILAQYDYKSESGSRAATVKTIYSKVPETKVYYNGGAFFENAYETPNTKVVATYENNLPAIIIISHGKGKAVLSGLHIEYDPSLLDLNDIYLKKIIPKLSDNNSSRKELFKELMKSLGIES